MQREDHVIALKMPCASHGEGSGRKQSLQPFDLRLLPSGTMRKYMFDVYTSSGCYSVVKALVDTSLIHKQAH